MVVAYLNKNTKTKTDMTKYLMSVHVPPSPQFLLRFDSLLLLAVPENTWSLIPSRTLRALVLLIWMIVGELFPQHASGLSGQGEEPSVLHVS